MENAFLFGGVWWVRCGVGGCILVLIVDTEGENRWLHYVRPPRWNWLRRFEVFGHANGGYHSMLCSCSSSGSSAVNGGRVEEVEIAVLSLTG